MWKTVFSGYDTPPVTRTTPGSSRHTSFRTLAEGIQERSGDVGERAVRSTG